MPAFSCLDPVLTLVVRLRYLSESIQKFYPQAKFSQMIEEAGFAVPKREPWEDLTFGVAAIHTGVKV